MTAARTTVIGVEELDRIAELLEITDSFLRAHLPTIDTDLDDLLVERGITGGPGWLIDTVGVTALALRIAASSPASTTGSADE